MALLVFHVIASSAMASLREVGHRRMGDVDRGAGLYLWCRYLFRGILSYIIVPVITDVVPIY